MVSYHSKEVTYCGGGIINHFLSWSRGGSDCVQIIVKIVHRDTLQFNDPPMRDYRND